MKRARIAAGVLGCVVGLVVCAAAASAATGLPNAAWREIGSSINATSIGGSSGLAGRVSAIVALPGTPVTEVAGTLGGIWRKSGSARWTDVTQAGWPSTAIGSLAVDPRRPQVLYAGTGYDNIDDRSVQPGAGVLRSADGGRTWAPLPQSEPLMRGYGVTGLAVSPKDDRVIVAAANNGIFRSGDSGQTWTPVLALPGPSEVRLAVDPVTGVMLAGVAQSGVSIRSRGHTVQTGHALFRSVDGGRSWQGYQVDAGLDSGLVLVPAIATARGRTYAYALDITGTRRSGLYTSADAGRTWRRTATGTDTKASIAQLVVDPTHPTHAFFAQADGPYQYTWGRHAFSVLTAVDGSEPQFGDWRALSIGPAARGHRALYSGFDGGTCFFDFTTRRFTDNDAGLVAGINYYVAAQSASLALTGAQDLGVQQLDGSRVADELWNADGYGVFFDQRRPRTLYAAVYPPSGAAGYVVSRDAGTTWRNVKLPHADSNIYLLSPVQAAGAPKVIVLPAQDGVVHVSDDDGAHWRLRRLPDSAEQITAVTAALIPHTTVPVVYVGTYFGGLWRSPDLGAHWTQVPVPLPGFGLNVTGIAIDRRSSTGAGREHVALALGVPSPDAYAQAGVVGGVLQSSDSGATWSDISGALSATSVNAVAVVDGTLVAGTDHGVEQYATGTWSPVGTHFPNVRVDDIAWSADGSALFASTYGRGILELVIAPRGLGGGGNVAPILVRRPSILGAPTIGSVLTATYGTWMAAAGTRYRLQWQRCRRRCANIPGATRRAYRLTVSDRGARVRVLVRASNRFGTRVSASRAAPVRARHVSVGTV